MILVSPVRTAFDENRCGRDIFYEKSYERESLDENPRLFQIAVKSFEKKDENISEPSVLAAGILLPGPNRTNTRIVVLDENNNEQLRCAKYKLSDGFPKKASPSRPNETFR